MRPGRAARAAGLAACVALAWLFVTPASAQFGEAGGVSDVPSGPGRIFGTVVHPLGPGKATGAVVVLYAISPDGTPGVRRSEVDAEGRFAFEGVATEPAIVYLLGARYAEVPYVGERLTFAAGESAREVEVRVAERTRSTGDISVEESTLRLERIGDEIVGTEVVRLRNAGERVVYLTPAEREAGGAAAFHAELPEGVVRFALPYALPPEGVVHDGRDVRFYGPVYPGAQELAFTWALPAGSGRHDLRKRFPSGAGRLSVLYPTSGLEITASTLTAADDAEIGGFNYRVLVSERTPHRGPVELSLSVPEARVDPDALSVTRTRAFLELDDAALTVSEEYHLQVDGTTPLAAPADAPLLRVPLPPDARDLGFGANGFSSGVTFENGALIVRGPVPAGESRLDIRYRLPSDAASVRWAPRFEQHVPLAEVFIADTGLSVSSDRLHRRRPVRTPTERIYLHFEAFHVTPGETLDVVLSPLPTRGVPGRAVRAGVVLLAAAGIMAFLAGPLRDDGTGDEELEEASPARRERDALYETIRDLDHDFETGKVADVDYRQMRDELLARAVALVAEERSRGVATSPADGDRQEARPEGPRPPQTCSGCGEAAAAQARFCAQCGARLEPGEAQEARG